jgi:threonyl-tRNA synthetase
MHGLIRVRQFTISEGHLVLRPEQLAEEFKGCLELAKYVLETVGLWEDCTFRFSQWDPKRTDKYEGTPEQWNEAQSIMGKLLDENGVKYEIGIDEAAFYGPKLDIQCKNVFGKEDTIVTIQIDMLLAKKFGMEYVDSNNQLATPYIIHRTSLGCYERTLALLIEKYAGALPLWLSPTQAVIIPINAEYDEYAKKVEAAMLAKGMRVEIDSRNETMGKRIREAQLQKTPYMIVVGANEAESGTVSVRARGGIDCGVMSIEDMVAKLAEEIETKKR